MINYYDKTKDIPALMSAKKIAMWLIENDDSDYLKINLYQINKRLNKQLTDNEIEDLLRIKNNTEDNLIKCAICILLESKIEFNKIFGKLNDEEKKRFESFPIYSLLDSN